MEGIEEIESNLLKSRSSFERVLVFLFFALFFVYSLYAVAKMMSFLDSDNKLIIYGLMIPVMYISYYLEGLYDKIVRGKIIGTVLISKDGIKIQSEILSDFKFKDVKIVWINYGLNLLTEERHEYLFEHFETIKIKIIDEEESEYNFHVNNHANFENRFIVSDFIENVRRKHHFFKIHFHKSSKFSQKEYEKTLKRHSLMKSSLRRRKKNL